MVQARLEPVVGNSKLLVIGLDGADWAILNPWLESGKLPHLAGLKARGQWGNLRSTIRPESSTAWSSFATGVNPGRHGVFGFSAQRPDSYEVQLNTSTAIRFPAFWQRAAAAGKRMVVFNVPMTYPPQTLANGALVAGMLTPSVRHNFTRPAELRDAMLAAVPDYVINVERTGLSLKRFIDETAKAIQARGRAAAWLLQRDDWDAAIVVFTATDRLQHFTLHLLNPDHPCYTPAEADTLGADLLAAYQSIDAAVGDLLALAGDDALTILLSDHGFAPFARTVCPNTWLEQHGYLQRHSTNAASPNLWQRLRAYPGLRRLKNALPGMRNWRRPPAPGGALAAIDWASTRAVYSPAGGIRLNVRGREPQGIVEPEAVDTLLAELKTAFLALTDPTTGTQPIVAAYHRGDLYTGSYIDLAPDLILEPRRSDPNPSHNASLAYGFANEVVADSGDYTGNHTLDGIFLAAGPGIKSGNIANAHLIDLAPTLLHGLGLPVPVGLDGRVLDLWADPAPVLWDDSDYALDPTAAIVSAFSAEDETAIEDRLRSLGYL